MQLIVIREELITNINYVLVFIDLISGTDIAYID